MRAGRSFLNAEAQRRREEIINFSFSPSLRLCVESYLLYAVLALALLFAGPAAAQLFGTGQLTASPGPFSGFKSTGKDPVEIVADRMEADLGSGNLRFLGHVRAKQGLRTIYAERMDVAYTEGGEVTTLVATGGVKVNMGDAFASSDRLELDNKKQVIRLLGSPRVAQGRQVMTGDLITYEMKTEQLSVKNPRIEWLPEQPGKPGKPGKAGAVPAAPGGPASASSPPAAPSSARPMPPASPAPKEPR